MKILFGGTFDPIHRGHILLALHISTLMHHPVSLLPLNGTPNYKPAPKTSLADRLAMLEIIATKYHTAIDIDYSETEITEYSPTVISLTRMRQIYGHNLPFYFIIGGDSLVNLEKWDEWQQLFSLTNFIVAMRPDYPLSAMSTTLAAQVTPRLSVTPKPDCAAGQIILTDFTPVAISSTAIRQAIARGNPLTDEWIEPEILDYITQHNLYKED